MNASALRVEELTVAYRRAGGIETPVVWRVGFSLEPGTVLGIAGESGCGKSTLALAAIGYRPPGGRIVEGSAWFSGVDLLRLADLRHVWGRRIAYVAQSASGALNPALPVGRQLAEVLALHLGLRRAALRRRQLELFEAVGIPDPTRALARYPHQFSGGQQQRISVAIALACRPDILILDEPTTGLDVTTQARVTALLRNLITQQGIATLYISHDLAVLSTLADRLAVMYAGEFVEEGLAGEVTAHPRHPYTRALLSAAPSVRTHRSVVGIPGQPPERVVLDACSFAPRCRYAVEACRALRVPLRRLDPERLVRCIRAEEIVGVLENTPALPPAPPPGETLLKVEDLYCEYRRAGITAVRGVSFTVANGETLGIVGESGSGKSTLLRAIAGLHPPQAGRIYFADSELPSLAVKRPRLVRGQIQLVFQDPNSSLNPRHTVAELIRRPIRLFRDMDRSLETAALIELLEAVKLHSAVLQRYPGELSGGQRQRVAIARAFAAKPSLLLCDEVTSALDVSVQATVIELIAELAASSGTAVILVSHDLAVVRTMASRALVMKSGEVCEEGEVGRLFAAPGHPYTKELLSSIPELPVGS